MKETYYGLALWIALFFLSWLDIPGRIQKRERI